MHAALILVFAARRISAGKRLTTRISMASLDENGKHE
jgi:hypothetical protein